MCLRKLLSIVGVLAFTSVAGAQSTTATISGRVVDEQGLSLPGVSVAVASPNLQGVRLAVTSENGDYIFALLPSGSYTVTFDLAGFQRVERQVNLAPTQVLPLEITLGLQGFTEVVQVVGRSSDVLTQTAQVATNFNQELISTLPTNRDVRSVMLMAPAVHPSGPNGAISVAGAVSFENLFMVNGVSIGENLRGQPQDLVIEDAIQETTVATAGISAEFGRFSGGVINVITKSGGNLFAGSFRETLTNDDWRALVPRREGDPYAGDSKLDDIVPTHEYTVGGPVIKDRLWFFHAGRLQTLTANRQLIRTNIPYVFTDKSARYEAKLTYSIDSNHRVQGSFIKLNRDQINNTFQTSQSLDLGSLEDRRLPEDLFTLNYTGALTPTFFIEGRYSQRNLTFSGSGSKFTDLQKGTLLVDGATRYNAATFCGVCTPEQRDNQDIFVKGTYFLSTGGAGSHTMAIGYDVFNDKRLVNNFQSGSNYRFLNAPAIVEGTNVIATIRSGTTEIQWNPIFVESQGTNFRTHSVFFNDNWRVTNRLTANLGVRWDQNRGVNSNGTLVAKEGAISPRLGVIVDPRGDGQWSVTASVAKYVAGLLSSIADVTSPAGNSDTYRFVYRGPDINVAPAARVSNEAAIQQVFDWFFANGGPTLPLSTTPSVRGVTPQMPESLQSPNVFEYAAGVNRQFGARAALRADYVYRNFKDFYIQRTDATTGRAIDTREFAPPTVRGREYDLSFIENDTSGLLKRRYSGLTLQGQYRFSSRVDIGANYTVSRTWGNVDGENPVSGPITDSSFQYPEYRQESWNYPEGDLSIDQRHRGRVWATVSPWGGLTLSVLQSLESGIPYSASNQNAGTFNGVDVRPYVANPGYLTPPNGQQIQYFYTARDAFRTEGMKRTDFAAMYTHGVGVGNGRKVDLFLQAQLINVFNQFQLCGCGGSTLFPLGGNLQSQTIDTGIRTNVSAPAAYQAFNPFTTTPVEGVNWDKSATFSKALNRFAYTTPRTFRMTFGVRF